MNSRTNIQEYRKIFKKYMSIFYSDLKIGDDDPTYPEGIAYYKNNRMVFIYLPNKKLFIYGNSFHNELRSLFPPITQDLLARFLGPWIKENLGISNARKINWDFF